jgi:hypothetical protein
LLLLAERDGFRNLHNPLSGIQLVAAAALMKSPPEDGQRASLWNPSSGHLSIVKGIVEAHGGEITVESGPGQGTTMIFSLPVHGDALPETPSEALVAPAPELAVRWKPRPTGAFGSCLWMTTP